MPAVSVIIPTYKHEQFVLATLDSVFAQTFKDYEVIVVNDGSPDGTHELLQPLAEQGLIRYFRQENRGQAAARNRGLAEAKGEFVAFLDDDDLWPVDSLEWKVEFLRATPEAGIICGPSLVLDSPKPPVFAMDGRLKEITFQELFTCCPCTSPGQALIRTSLVRQIGGFDESLWGTDDYDLWMRLCRITRMFRCYRVGLYYRKHESNASRNTLRMFRNVLKVFRKALGDCPPAQRATFAAIACNNAYLNHAMWMMWEWRRQLARGQFIQAARTWGGILSMAALFSRHDPSGLKLMGWHLLPRPVRDFVARPRELAEQGA